MVNKANKKLLAELFNYISEKLPQDQASKLVRFAELYYQSVVFEEYDKIVVGDLYGAVLSHWNLALDLTTEQKIRVFNPTLEEDGWESKNTIIEIVVKDMPFLLQSLTMEVNRQGFANRLVIHPIYSVKRDNQGRFESFSSTIEAETEAINECFVHLEVDRQTDTNVLLNLEKSLASVIRNVRATTDDWSACKGKLKTIIQALKQNDQLNTNHTDEIDFLQWLHDDHFVFLGYREYQINKTPSEYEICPVPKSGLGVLRDAISPLPKGLEIPLSNAAYQVINNQDPLIITKATSKSTVHRPVFMDYIAVKQYGETGEVVGEKRFLGLYSSTAYSCLLREIPMISTKIKRLQEIYQHTPNSHLGRALLFTLHSLPRDELFQGGIDSLYEFTEGMLQMQQRQRVRVFVRHDIFGHFASLIIFVPRDRYYTETRRKIQKILLDIFHADDIEFTVQLSESIMARIHFIIHSKESRIVDYDVKDIEEQIVHALANWKDDLKQELRNHHGEAIGNQLYNHYAGGFTAAYREEISARTAILDIARVENLMATNQGAESLLYSPITTEERKVLRFKLFSKGQASLSKTLPILENMGVKVCDERPYEISKKGSEQIFWMHDFGLILEQDAKLINLSNLKPRFEETFEKCWFGKVENDGFNQLVLRAEINWQEVNIFRAYFLYLRQIGMTFSQSYVENTLANNPSVVRLLTHYFIQRFDPSLKQEENSSEELRQTIEQAIDQVKSLDEDRILRRFLNLINAAVRTNYFQYPEDERGVPYFSTKFDSSKINEVPSPVPYFEIFVYSPRMEGIHLRGGAVARGGLRWSDRREDFRTEILGLMKAQMTKNAVIVPTGAKGGFVVKQLEDHQDKAMEVVSCYRVLIRGLLDLTDNRVSNNIVKPNNTVCYDSDDSYLVVAADKGTAKFSDYANELSEEYGFWLGDAFASGGSTGYDHKKMGITARGAWESVKHHFNRLRIAYLDKPYTAIGIGGMMGDVFGNGLLLSEQIQLVGAFDHEFIFLDPDPDPKQSFLERKRLFVAERPRWSDYDEKLISKGGGVFARDLKSITLTPQVKQRLNITQDQLPPNDVIKALLCAPVDLLWNGGIGTYVKASYETNQDVGDKANDALRVDGGQLRCRVVGEGGNLGFTQAGRIEFALNGGAVNTDSIDNSAGVDCSDHEVNIKILLNSVVEQGDLTNKHRNILLQSMTEDVAALVLKNNYDQNRAISMVERHSATDIVELQWLMNLLENKGNLNRQLETVPNHNLLEKRKNSSEGLVRPEISVLLAYSKQLLKHDLQHDLAGLNSLTFQQQLINYFPSQLQEKYAQEIKHHYLAKDIVVNELVNDFVNRMGMTLAFKMVDETGVSLVGVFNVYAQVCRIYAISELWRQIEMLDSHLDIEIQEILLHAVRQLIKRAMYWFLNQDYSLEAESDFFQGITDLKRDITAFITSEGQLHIDEKTTQLIEQGVPESLAKETVMLDVLYLSLNAIQISQQTTNNLTQCAQVFFQLLESLDLIWLRDHIAKLPENSEWESLARRSALNEFNILCRHLSLAALSQSGENSTEKIFKFLDVFDTLVKTYRMHLAACKTEQIIKLENVTVLLKELRDICVCE